MTEKKTMVVVDDVAQLMGPFPEKHYRGKTMSSMWLQNVARMAALSMGHQSVRPLAPEDVNAGVPDTERNR